ncbi:nitric oxide reductase activation protein NorD [Rhizobium sp. L1K21]|uniref:nitric oxide reductase activation protein NorD n=1 Tax=Rhizobium sp. L1K21 TaxID=2954933 RepID=UPI002091EC9A|nr:VWA domain-containing protein [Rhizobium sp. L1K21]MCO6187758.1 VWA domain-containing protein [Rhizobium sp. L1K21]
MHLLDLMEPEETVGHLWHGIARDMGRAVTYPDAAVRMDELRQSLVLLFHALGGSGSVEISEAPATIARHRRSLTRRLSGEQDKEWVPTFDGERLRLPPLIAAFEEEASNRAAYFWLAATAALSKPEELQFPESDDAIAFDRLQIAANAHAGDCVYRECPGLRPTYETMVRDSLKQRPDVERSAAEADIENAIRGQLDPTANSIVAPNTAVFGYKPFAPVPIWLRFEQRRNGGAATEEQPDSANAPSGGIFTTRKMGERKDQDQARRRDSFIMHRFEAILSWVESMNLNRSVDDDEEDNAKKAADDQEKITLSKHHKKAATRLRLHLDLSPADADHEKLAGEHVYPEWDHRTKSYLDNHCRVLDAPAVPDANDEFRPNARQIRAVRRQFETLRPRRMLRPRQIDGAELDLDALISAQADLQATGRGSDRIWQDVRQSERDLAVAFLIDTSRSTEAAIGDTSIIDVAREAMTALAFGIDAAGDRLGIWGFSSLRRDRVFLTKVKAFDAAMGASVTANIGSLKPGFYTRLGAAIRHVSTQLSKETASRKLLIVLTDGKPNDLDHYEGQHGIEDSHMAVREARRSGLSLHGVIIDEDGQDWFARIFGRGGFTLLPHPERLTRALPEIYRTLTQEN